MARTASTMLELGTQAPAFSLIEPATGETLSLQQFVGKPILIAFICNHCPYVINLRTAFVDFSREYQDKGIQVVAINSNDVENYAEDSPENMAEHFAKYGYTFPYLFDESQAVAKAYKAACTPDFFLFDAGHNLYYRGQFDDSRPSNDIPSGGVDMRIAVNALLEGKQFPEDQIPSLGCNIKWKAGNEPDYSG
jgi:peroxiredoxin